MQGTTRALPGFLSPLPLPGEAEEGEGDFVVGAAAVAPVGWVRVPVLR